MSGMQYERGTICAVPYMGRFLEKGEVDSVTARKTNLAAARHTSAHISSNPQDSSQQNVKNPQIRQGFFSILLSLFVALAMRGMQHLLKIFGDINGPNEKVNKTAPLSECGDKEKAAERDSKGGDHNSPRKETDAANPSPKGVSLPVVQSRRQASKSFSLGHIQTIEDTDFDPSDLASPGNSPTPQATTAVQDRSDHSGDEQAQLDSEASCGDKTRRNAPKTAFHHSDASSYPTITPGSESPFTSSEDEDEDETLLSCDTPPKPAIQVIAKAYDAWLRLVPQKPVSSKQATNAELQERWKAFTEDVRRLTCPHLLGQTVFFSGATGRILVREKNFYGRPRIVNNRRDEAVCGDKNEEEDEKKLEEELRRELKKKIKEELEEKFKEELEKALKEDLKGASKEELEETLKEALEEILQEELEEALKKELKKLEEIDR